ncbi:hypothetical protein PHISP_03690 [Aspergillus sp. HF37]|nr:hypothetical protein PHISP_03690 [Aspergillus sp. HF37]
MLTTHGALGATFHLARLFEECSLIAIIGMTAKFISDIVSNDATPPSILIGTITVTCIAVIYCIITTILLLDDILPFLACACMDGLVLIALIVVSVIIGKPVSYLDCRALGGGAPSSTLAFTTHLSSMLDGVGGKVEYENWIGASKAICLETKAIWGLCIALCILFFFSGITTAFLWRRKKAVGGDKLGD